MKKMLLATALAPLITGCVNTGCLSFKTTGAEQETITHHFLFRNWQKKTGRCQISVYGRKCC